MVVAVFPSAGTGKLVRIEGMMDGAKCMVILEGNLSQSSRDLSLGRKFTFHQDKQDNDPKHIVKATPKWFKGKHCRIKVQTSTQLRICGMT